MRIHTARKGKDNMKKFKQSIAMAARRCVHGNNDAWVCGATESGGME